MADTGLPTWSWLSQWSLDAAQVDTGDAAARVRVPVLAMINGGDDAVPTSHALAVFDAIPHQEKELVHLAGANRNFSGTDQRLHPAEAADLVHDWLARQTLGAPSS